MNFLKISKLNVLLVVGLISGMSQFAMATHETTWNGEGDGVTWHDGDNWDMGRPNFDSLAVIPNGYNEVQVEADPPVPNEADAITIESGAKLRIMSGATLKIKDHNDRNSNIDGELNIEKDGELIIDDSHTITGDGGFITGLTTGGSATAKITGTSGTDELTIDGNGTDPHSQADSVVIDGTIDIEVKLKNDGFVVAKSGKTVTLKTNAKSGLSTGHWTAEGTGKLKVDVEITGDATWQLIDNSSAEIEINADSTSLTGDFDIQEGRLDINATIDTSGDLIFRSNAGSRPRIEVAKGETATFG